MPFSDIGSELKWCCSGSEFKGEENSTLSLGGWGQCKGPVEKSVGWDVLLWPSVAIEGETPHPGSPQFIAFGAA